MREFAFGPCGQSCVDKNSKQLIVFKFSRCTAKLGTLVEQAAARNREKETEREKSLGDSNCIALSKNWIELTGVGVLPCFFLPFPIRYHSVHPFFWLLLFFPLSSWIFFFILFFFPFSGRSIITTFQRGPPESNGSLWKQTPTNRGKKNISNFAFVDFFVQ